MLEVRTVLGYSFQRDSGVCPPGMHGVALCLPERPLMRRTTWADLKDMYKNMQKDAFPETMTIILGDESWNTASGHGNWTGKPRGCAITRDLVISPRPSMNSAAAASPAAA